MGLTSPSEFSSLFNTVLFISYVWGARRENSEDPGLNNMGIPFLQPFPEQLGTHQAPTLEEMRLKRACIPPSLKVFSVHEGFCPSQFLLSPQRHFIGVEYQCKQKKEKNGDTFIFINLNTN